MTREDRNRYIHTEILGNPDCEHNEIRGHTKGGNDHTTFECEKCGTVDDNPDNESLDVFTIPDYHSEESPRRLLNEVEAKVIAERGREVYARWLHAGLVHSGLPGLHYRVAWSERCDLATASAEARCIALVEAWRNENGSDEE